MFNNKRIGKLENEVMRLRGRILDLEGEVKVWTHIYFKPSSYENEQKVRIATVVEDLLKILGYEIEYKYTREKEEYSLKKIIEIPKKSKGKKK